MLNDKDNHIAINVSPVLVSEILAESGYTPNSAISDLIDNSIFAEAKNIWIDVEWKDRLSNITITDDGNGINESEIDDKLIMGSQDFTQERDIKDLGRFGVGLKGASLSQCDFFTVSSKPLGSNNIVSRVWDKEYNRKINQVVVKPNLIPPTAAEKRLSNLSSGTSITLEKLRDLSWRSKKTQEVFLDRFITQLEPHISQYFHKYLQKKSFNIYINNKKIETWDPFLQNLDNSSKKLFEEKIETDLGNIEVIGYRLPHINSISKKSSNYLDWKAQRDKALLDGISNQGFYFYRNDRLIKKGVWMNKSINHNRFNLARIEVNFPNTLDKIMGINVIKDEIQITDTNVRNELLKYERITQREATRPDIYREEETNKKIKKGEIKPIWNVSISEAGYLSVPTINKSNALIDFFIKNYKKFSLKDIKDILTVIEKGLPFEAMQNLIYQNDQLEIENFSNGEAFEIGRKMIRNIINEGNTFEYIENNVLPILRSSEPMFKNPEIISKLRSEYKE